MFVDDGAVAVVTVTPTPDDDDDKVVVELLKFGRLSKTPIKRLLSMLVESKMLLGLG